MDSGSTAGVGEVAPQPPTRPSLVARRWSLDHPPAQGLWACGLEDLDLPRFSGHLIIDRSSS